MLFSTKTFLSGAVSALLLIQGVLADDCTTGPLADLSTIGQDHDGGTGFCYTKWAIGLTVTGIEAWQTGWQIKAIKMTFSDGSSMSAGDQESTGTKDDPDAGHQILKWGPSDIFSEMTIAPNKANDGLGLLDFIVAGKHFHMESEYDTTQKKKIDVGSGVFLGAGGQAGGFMHRWSPLFLGTLTGTAKVTAMDFHETPEQLAKDQSQITQLNIQESYITNDNPAGSSDAGMSWSFNVAQSRQQTITDSNTDTKTFGFEIGTEVSGTVGIPLLGEATVKDSFKASFQYQTSSTHSLADATAVTFTNQVGSSANGDLLKAGHAMHCQAYVYTGHYNGDYTRTVQVTVDGQQFVFKQTGSMETISYTTTVNMKCNDVLVADIPNGANTTTAADSMKESSKSGRKLKRAQLFKA